MLGPIAFAPGYESSAYAEVGPELYGQPVGGKPPYTWSSTTPSGWSGFTLSSDGQTITGTASATPGSANFTINVTDSFGWPMESRVYSITTLPGAPP